MTHNAAADHGDHERRAAATAVEGAVTQTFGVYGPPLPALVDVPARATQYSPLVAGASALEDAPASALASFVLLAPPSTLERRYVIALALRAVKPGSPFTVLALKDKGGARIGHELEAFGAEVRDDARRHHRICTTLRPATPTGLDEAIAEGSLRFVDAIGLWSQPGVFSWDRIDPGTALLASILAAQLPLAGRVADLGCGIGTLARATLAASTAISELTLIDRDRRAIAAARLNVPDARARFTWSDVRAHAGGLTDLDAVVMNPPFHDGGAEDRALGQDFVRIAARMLRRGGRCVLVANRHLPYEGILASAFRSVALLADRAGYKVYEAVK